MQPRILGLTKQLVRLKTFHPNFEEKQRCLDFIADSFRADFHIRKFKFNRFPSLLLSTTKTNHYDLVLAGHIDVVPAPDSMFQVVEKNGKLLGRGVYDMKASVAVMLLSLQRYIREGGNKRVGLLLTSDEEIDGLNGTKAVLEKTKLTADFALLPDNGWDWQIVIAEKGLLHVSVPEPERETVAQTLASKFSPSGQSTMWHTTYSTSSRDVKVRFVNKRDQQAAARLLSSYDVVRQHDHMSLSPRNQHVRILARAVTKVTGKPAAFGKEVLDRESDGVYFNQKDIPVAFVRPIGGGEHKSDEWVSISALEQLSQILRYVLDGPSY